jgi:hypothetical protein
VEYSLTADGHDVVARLTPVLEWLHTYVDRRD